MTGIRLAPGVTVVAVPGRGAAVRTADGEFLRVATGDVPVADLLDRLSGDGADAPDTADGEPEPALARLLGAFAAAGYTRTGDAPGPPRDRWPARLRTVWLLGDAVLTEPLGDCLRRAGAAPRPAAPGEVAALVREAAPGGDGRPAAVVWCLDGPVPAGLWDDADRLPALGVAWLRCHREGRQLWLEPPAVAPGDVTAAQVRLRRLAATPAHRELAAYWAGERVTGDDRFTTPASAALAAALLTADLADWATGARGTGEAAAPAAPGALPARRRLRRVDLRGLTVTEHPVLPVPDVAPLPAPRGAA
ncbi:hypothetical protein V1L54_16855 [Streptomyces sp. TRM 70361]|uniref:hypothetical protein n=1 Tax=Streptomyces sp. TRM 70361 TaxID=3116553 RepID=UPI002E7AB313|nr:hypothetical protein [Streptomyces sp. TRM 70361]MEE1941053.1 hypothetical protein [Streptomyces sp. TRM 70361]